MAGVRQLLAGPSQGSPADFLTAALTVDQGLVLWLQELNVDSGTIQTVRGRELDSHQPKTPPLPIFQLFSLSPLIQRISVLEEHLVSPAYHADEKTKAQKRVRSALARW